MVLNIVPLRISTLCQCILFASFIALSHLVNGTMHVTWRRHLHDRESRGIVYIQTDK